MLQALIMLTLVFLSHSNEANAANVATEHTKGMHDFESISKEPGAVMFTPPKNWHVADQNALPDSVRVMVIGKGSYRFPPSINLSTEEFGGSLRDYLKIVKNINATQGSVWRNLGSIKTDAGTANLSQTDTQTEWGPVRMMHVILLRNGVVYILTAAALKSDFPKLYQTFFQTFKSLQINEDPAKVADKHGNNRIDHD